MQAQRLAASSGRSQRALVSCHAAAPTRPVGNPLLMAAVEALFKFPPFFDMATKQVSGWRGVCGGGVHPSC